MNPTGTGLGLSICKLIVEKMRGNIEVKSKVNVGTTFQVIISSKAIIKQGCSLLKKLYQMESSDAFVRSSHDSLQRMDAFRSLTGHIE